MGICNYCRYWVKDEKQLVDYYSLGECHHPYWRCWVPQGSVSEHLATEGTFGCVQFEKQDLSHGRINN